MDKTKNFNELVLSDKVQEALPEMLKEMYNKAYRAASYFMLVLDENGDLRIVEEVSSNSTPGDVWHGKAVVVESEEGFGPSRFDWDGEPTDEEIDEYVYEVIETEWIDIAINEIENKANQGWY
jgi:hypothetical protein